MKYTLVTVAHRDDLKFLHLQARSLQLYLSRDLAAEILVVKNSRAKQATRWPDSLRREYGDLADLVRFIEANEIAEIPTAASGWFSQQILKLMVSQVVKTDRYLLLDAKNHLVFPLTRNFLEAGNKIRSRLVNFEGHPLEPFFERTMRYFGMNPSEHIRAFLPTVTPFTLPTRVVRELVEYVTQRENEPFPVAFLKQGLTEFFLFTSFISSRGLTIRDFYDLSGGECPTVWAQSAKSGAGAIAELIAHGEKNALAFFAVHRRALPKLDEKSRRVIADFWQRRGLFNTSVGGVHFLNDWISPNFLDSRVRP